MKVLYVEPDKSLDTKSLLKGKALQNDDPIIKEDTVIKHKTTGETLLIYVVKSGLDTGGMIESLSRVKFSKNVRSNGLATQSEIIGYRPRMSGAMGKKTCAKTAFGNKYKSIEDSLYEVAKGAEVLYKEYAPERHANHNQMSKQVHDTYRIPETSFTSGIVNKNNPLKYHLDAGNFKDVFSIMLGLKQNTGGGYLHIPELHINLEVANGSLSIFDGQKFVHGVTPMTTNKFNSYRFTIVFYSLVQMWACLETAQEVGLARQREDEKLTRLLTKIQNEDSNM